VGIALFWPIEPIMPVNVDLANQIMRGEELPRFTPVGYPLLIAGWIGGSVEATLRSVHLASLVATWAVIAWSARSAWLAARPSGGPSAAMPWWRFAWIAFWVLAVVFNPYFLIGLVRVSDNAVNILFMAVVLACALAAPRASMGSWIVAGLAVAIFTAVRPNALTLVPALAVMAVTGQHPFRHVMVMITAAAVAFVIVCLLATGKPVFWPGNGGYNLFAGNNPFAFDEFASNYQAEYSLDKALAWCGVKGDRYEVADRDYLACTIRFATERPGEVVQLVAYKAYTMLFRPNLRLADTLPKVAVQYLILVPTYAWWALFLASRSFRASLPGLAGFLFVALYSVPFLLTNADPRFRIPLDVIYAMSALAFALGDRAPWRAARRASNGL
jgi:hypothetical protein